MAKYDIKLKNKDGIFKVAEFEAEPAEAPQWLAKYIFRHYPVSFYTLVIDAEGGDKEHCLKDGRTDKLVWRPGNTIISLLEGEFFYEPNGEPGETPYERWHKALPGVHQRIVTTEMDKAYDKGRNEGFEEGVAHGMQIGKVQGNMDAGTHHEHHG